MKSKILPLIFLAASLAICPLAKAQKDSDLPHSTALKSNDRMRYLDPDDHAMASTGSNKTISFSDFRTSLSIPSGGSGTVSSITLAVPSGLSVSGSPVTSAGTITITTSLNGIVKGSGGGFSIAAPGIDYLAPTGSGVGLTGITPAQIGLANVQNTALTTWAGSTNLTTLGTIATGTWQATPIVDAYIASAAAWNAKQSAITTGTTAQYLRGDLSLATLNAAAVGLGSVENTALSTWPGSSHLTTFSGGTFGTAAASATSAFEVPLTFSTGLTRTGSTITVNGAAVTGLTATQVGLGSVNNTSDATKNAAAVTLTNHTINGASNTLTVRLANDVTGILPVANGGTGTGTPGIVAGSNVTVTGTWPNQTIAASGGGGASITVTHTAYISQGGNNSTGVIGDPGHPYATAQAAWTAGATTFVIEPATGWDAGGITASADMTITVIGSGFDRCNLGAVSDPGHAVTIMGNGSAMVYVASISTKGPNGMGGAAAIDSTTAANAAGHDGVAGGNGGSLTITGIYVGSFETSGGSGGSGTDSLSVDLTAPDWSGSGVNGGNGQPGGQAGTMTATDCLIGSGVLLGGAGGNGGMGGQATDNNASGTVAPGGNAGTAGFGAVSNAVNLNRCQVTGALDFSPGAGGAGANGGQGANSGPFGTSSSAADGGDIFGSVIADFSNLTAAPTNSTPPVYRFVIEAGVAIQTQN